MKQITEVEFREYSRNIPTPVLIIELQVPSLCISLTANTSYDKPETIQNWEANHTHALRCKRNNSDPNAWWNVSVTQASNWMTFLRCQLVTYCGHLSCWEALVYSLQTHTGRPSVNIPRKIPVPVFRTKNRGSRTIFRIHGIEVYEGWQTYFFVSFLSYAKHRSTLSENKVREEH